MKTVLIFGSNGFVGQYLTEEFQSHGYQVMGSDIEAPARDGQPAAFYPCDLLHQETVFSLIQKTRPDCIINLAGVSSVGFSWLEPQTTVSVNVIGTLHILEGIRSLPGYGPRALFIGSSEEYEASDAPIREDHLLKANSPYGISKLAQEKFVDLYRSQYGMKLYYTRPFNHTGIGQKDTFVLPSFCRQVAQIEKSQKPGVISVGNLDIVRDFCDVRDVARAYRLILESGDCSSVYNIGSGKTYTLRRILEYIISLSSQNIQIQVDPNRFRPVDNPIICCDSSWIKQQLNWEPQHDLFDTLKEMYHYYLQ